MEFADQVKSQVDIVRTVGEYLVLRKMGARYLALCPFHNEKTPSFNVNPGIQRYICFGCGVRGDVIDFVQRIESLTFWEALKSLAERNGIPVPQRSDHSDEQDELRAAVFDMHAAAARIFQEALFSGPAQEVRDYLSKRGVNAATAQQFGLGYSEPGWENLVRRFGRKYTSKQMEESGLFTRRDDGSFYDKFRGRLMFPIQNENGKVIGFGGRALKAEDEPKYLNSPETPIYKKSTVLYNLHRAKETIRKDDRTILVEGYMDVIGVYAAGVHNVVASCGTALTPAQVRSMKRHSPKIVVNFDPDIAGANATERSIQMLIDEGMHVRVLELEAGLDPDEYIKKHGAATYQSRLSQAAGYFLWLAGRARHRFDMSSAEGRMEGYQTLLLPAIRRITDRLERAGVAGEVADYLGLDRNMVLEEFRRTPGHRVPQPPKAPKTPPIPARQLELLRSLVINPEIRSILIPRIRMSPGARQFVIWPVLETMLGLYETDPRFSYEALDGALSEADRAIVTSELFSDDHRDSLAEEHLTEAMAWLDAEDRRTRLDAMDKEIRDAEKAGDVQSALRLMAQRDELKRDAIRSGIS